MNNRLKCKIKVNMAESQGLTTNSNNLYDLLSTKESPIKWNGTLEQLKTLFEKKLNLTGEWSSSVDKCKVIRHFFKSESSSVTITSYPSTKTLQIQGEGKDDVKQLLLQKGSRPSANVEHSSENGDTRLGFNDSIAIVNTT